MSVEEIENRLHDEYCNVLKQGLRPSLVIISPENYEKIKEKFFSDIAVNWSGDIKQGALLYRGINIYRSYDEGEKIIVK